jgi:hypothetical protein
MEIILVLIIGIFYLINTLIRSLTMKGVAVVLGMFAIIMFANGRYDIDLFKGKVQFQSAEEEIEYGMDEMFADKSSFKGWPPVDYADRQVAKADAKQKNAQTASDLTRLETDTGGDISPDVVRLHVKNRLRNGDLMVVKRRLFGNNMRDGYRWVFYFYGANDLGSMLDIMKNELGLDNKFTMTRYKRGDKYSWIEVRSRFILVK